MRTRRSSTHEAQADAPRLQRLIARRDRFWTPSTGNSSPIRRRAKATLDGLLAGDLADEARYTGSLEQQVAAAV